ncbi:MAG: MBL fold metallo-hydrolase, partial [Actinomycetes bacterium]
MSSFVLGDVEVVKVVEWQGAIAPARDVVPGVTADVWAENQDWLAPDHWDPAGDMAVGVVQSWVLRSGGRTVLVDTGVGDGRERPSAPLFHRRQGDLLGRLARAGVRPQDVDVVVNTHIHADHVGANTVEVAGEYLPAFPNARYLVPAADDAHFGPEGGYANGLREDDRLIYEDSIAPVHRAGQVVLWEHEYRIDEHLTLEPAPGHTPGSSVLRLASGSDRAVFVG